MSDKYSPRCNGDECCGEGPTCILYSETFTGSDSSSIGSQWTEVVGDWERVSNRLVVTSASDPAVLVASSAPSQQEYSMTWTFENTSSGDVLRFVVGYVDANNYYFARVPIGSSVTLSLYQRSGGVETLLTSRGSIDTSSLDSFTTCYSGAYISAYFGTAEHTRLAWPPSSAFNLTDSFGVSVEDPVTTSDVRFVSVVVSKVSSDCELCNPGNCCFNQASPPFTLHCLFDEEGPPRYLQADVSGVVHTSSPTTCPWCNGYPANGSWIGLNNVEYSAVDPCGEILPGSQCIYNFREPIDLTPDACMSSLKTCLLEVTISIIPLVAGVSFRVSVTQALRTIGPSFSCTDECDGSTSAFLRWHDDFTWPAGGISALFLDGLSLPPDPTFLTPECDTTAGSCVLSLP